MEKGRQAKVLENTTSNDGRMDGNLSIFSRAWFMVLTSYVSTTTIITTITVVLMFRQAEGPPLSTVTSHCYSSRNSASAAS